jgi:hypothetical protein
MTFRTLTAKYAGTCRRCKLAFEAGTKIRYAGPGQTWHLANECPTPQAQPAPAPLPAATRPDARRLADIIGADLVARLDPGYVAEVDRALAATLHPEALGQLFAADLAASGPWAAPPADRAALDTLSQDAPPAGDVAPGDDDCPF